MWIPRSWRSLVPFFFALSLGSAVGSLAHAGPVTLTLQNDYASVLLPSYRPPQPPVSLSFTVQVALDPGWTYDDSWGSSGGVSTTFFYSGNTSELMAFITPLTGVGRHLAYFAVQARNSATGETAMESAYVTIDVVTRDQPVVPEPASVWLLGLGAVGVGGRFLRRAR